MANLVTVAEAVEHSVYTREHLVWLVRNKKVSGRKGGGVWLIDLDSLKAYEAKMSKLGDQRFNPKRSTHS
jgi:hypothetical protein